MQAASCDVDGQSSANNGRATVSVALVPYKPGPEAILEQDFEGTLEKIRVLGSCWLTRAQIAAKLRVNRNTLWRFMRKFPEAEEAYQAGLDEGDGDLATAQKIAACQKLDPTMLKWLGQHRLGQRDKKELEVGVTVRHENMLDRIALLEREGKL